MTRPCAGWASGERGACAVRRGRAIGRMDGSGFGRHGGARQTAARRVQRGVERFAGSGAGNIKRLQGIDPPEFRLRVGDWRVRFHRVGKIIRILRVLHRTEAYR